ncbi:30S ribosomal protein S2, partial [Staphylococcus saprophyticus]|uniref:30S ribosomal protein S2 n=1 Tax=Staphylococcus saprophyticus TaxID=29385 RepID=UPI001C930AEF
MIPLISIKQFLQPPLHFPHQTPPSNPKIKTYIFTHTNPIYIIHLQKTLKKLQQPYNF